MLYISDMLPSKVPETMQTKLYSIDDSISEGVSDISSMTDSEDGSVIAEEVNTSSNDTTAASLGLFIEYLRRIMSLKCDSKMKYHFDHPTRSLFQVFDERMRTRIGRLNKSKRIESKKDIERDITFLTELVVYAGMIFERYFNKKDIRCERYDPNKLSLDDNYKFVNQIINDIYELDAERVDEIILYEIPRLSAMYDIADSFILVNWGKYLLLECIISCFTDKFSDNAKHFRRDFNQTAAFSKCAYDACHRSSRPSCSNSMANHILQEDLTVPLYFRSILASVNKQSSKQIKQIQLVCACAESLLTYFQIKTESIHRLQPIDKLTRLIKMMESNETLSTYPFRELCNEAVTNAHRQYYDYLKTQPKYLESLEMKLYQSILSSGSPGKPFSGTEMGNGNTSTSNKRKRSDDSLETNKITKRKTAV